MSWLEQWVIVGIHRWAFKNLFQTTSLHRCKSPTVKTRTSIRLKGLDLTLMWFWLLYVLLAWSWLPGLLFQSLGRQHAGTDVFRSLFVGTAERSQRIHSWFRSCGRLATAMVDHYQCLGSSRCWLWCRVTMVALSLDFFWGALMDQINCGWAGSPLNGPTTWDVIHPP